MQTRKNSLWDCTHVRPRGRHLHAAPPQEGLGCERIGFSAVSVIPSCQAPRNSKLKHSGSPFVSSTQPPLREKWPDLGQTVVLFFEATNFSTAHIAEQF